ncbi:MAG: radical SAM protein [Bacteroidota bacterium]
MQRNPIILIAFLEQDNLGVGYIASLLLKNKIDVKIIDFRLGNKGILEHIRFYNPLVVGFSIIFQYHIYDFRNLVNYLRINEVNSHFSAGGHYPSLRYKELLDIIPELDSVVLFEGENTFLELVQSIRSDNRWKEIRGIACKSGSSVITNELRPLERDLDLFPPPVRQPLKEYAFGKKYATLVAGRGCYYNCSFCSIREFYSKPPGAIKRLRRPEMVVREMELIHQKLGGSVFMFQDDDFPVASKKGNEWVTTFCELLTKKELDCKIMWKINCRPDEIEKDLFRLMRDSGLFLVYLGIESGTDDGLRFMNKRMNVETTINAIRILKELDIKYDFGFMLFHPTSTFRSISENLEFLMEICGDGSSPITFCKMLPYAETKVEFQLKKEGRLTGGVGFENYDFLDPSLNKLYSFLTDCYSEWISHHDGLLNMARWARYYISVYNKYHQKTSEIDNIENEVIKCVSQSNHFLLDTVKSLVTMFSKEWRQESHSNQLKIIRESVVSNHIKFKSRLTRIMNEFDGMVKTVPGVQAGDEMVENQVIS